MSTLFETLLLGIVCLVSQPKGGDNQEPVSYTSEALDKYKESRHGYQGFCLTNVHSKQNNCAFRGSLYPQALWYGWTSPVLHLQKSPIRTSANPSLYANWFRDMVWSKLSNKPHTQDFHCCHGEQEPSSS